MVATMEHEIGAVGRAEDSKSRMEAGQAVSQDQDLLSALRQIARQAGIATTPWDLCQFTDKEAYAFDGTVHTTLRYPFGFVASVRASELAQTIPHLSNPKITVDNATITIKDTGRLFRVPLLITKVQDGRKKPNEKPLLIQGSWLRPLLATTPLPGKSMFPGIYVSAAGFVSTDMSSMSALQLDTHIPGSLLPRSLIDSLPAEPVQMWISPDFVVAEAGTVTWTSPTLYATAFPDWGKAISTPERTAIAHKGKLLSAAKAVGVVSDHAWLRINKEQALFDSLRMIDGTNTDAGGDAQASFSVRDTLGEIKVPIGVNRLTTILDFMPGEEIEIGTTDRQDRIQLRPVGSRSNLVCVVAGIRGVA
jgi:hypothetical protein